MNSTELEHQQQSAFRLAKLYDGDGGDYDNSYCYHIAYIIERYSVLSLQRVLREGLQHEF